MDEEIEQTLLIVRDAAVYKIPPARSANGHYAADWSELIFNARLVVRSKGKKCNIRLEDPSTGELFGECPVFNEEGKIPRAVDTVLDSSRYFVLRLDDGKGHHAFVGMGFQERGTAFDFNVALQDHEKQVTRENNPIPEIENLPKRDLSLKEGQTIHVSLNVKKPAGAGSSSSSGSSGIKLGGSGGILAPPPPSSRARRVPAGQSSAPPSSTPGLGSGFGNSGFGGSATVSGSGGFGQIGFGDSSFGTSFTPTSTQQATSGKSGLDDLLNF
uniref:NECAP PHear domain-containing protein n=2 Tax=Palpitomonas bilix TaxID=652834 RepID=A0A7S3GGK7_9EUKA|mmetsp:Transcript_48335/g.125360  ORF Transcript_48335/g.125360 Transcript_48335/m.125360 type:complete len:271 (+) Transcript_48335:61-873(+)|eukprot:CAMPEP_0113903748 /NCGR_PEP_ID=MMETSP0780_2-20120614/22763_1 /TAXON_ID=652834 /ORGANISM="Palpitomonas bilix" /LENGTH=270 /DNA_ID=CAMNT_0000897069 /DNA_START=32 /DNA_END=844 /DNA_ORIENTATION=- /assembly_acc=CAM_ASM_000599